MGAAWKPGQLGGSDRRGVGISCRGGVVRGAGQGASPESTNTSCSGEGGRSAWWLQRPALAGEWVGVSSFWKV